MKSGRTKNQQAKVKAIHELLIMSLRIKDGLSHRGKSQPKAKQLAGELALQLTKDLISMA